MRGPRKATAFFVDVGEVGHRAGKRVPHPYQLPILRAELDRHRLPTGYLGCPADVESTRRVATINLSSRLRQEKDGTFHEQVESFRCDANVDRGAAGEARIVDIRVEVSGFARGEGGRCDADLFA